MFTYAKMQDRDYAARVVMILQRKTCGYRSSSDPLKRVICDCKYGIGEYPDSTVMGHHGEQNGCCELAMLEEIIRSIPKREWERIVKGISQDGSLKRVRSPLTGESFPDRAKRAQRRPL